jgi:hypothetical protein
VRQRLGHHLRLHGEQDHRLGPERPELGIEGDAVARDEVGRLRRRVGVERGDESRVEAEAEPSLEHGAAHLAGADEEEAAADIEGPFSAHASP